MSINKNQNFDFFNNKIINLNQNIKELETKTFKNNFNKNLPKKIAKEFLDQHLTLTIQLIHTKELFELWKLENNYLK